MTKIKHLKLNKLCRTFTFREIAVFTQFVREESFKKGSVIFKEGEEGDRLFMVIDGEVGVKSELLGKGEENIMTFGPGDFFGELSLFDAGPRRITTVAIADNTILFSISRKDFNNMCSTDSFVSYKLIMEMIGVFSNKLKESKKELSELLSMKKADI